LKFATELQTVYLRGTTKCSSPIYYIWYYRTYLRTPLFGIIPVVTLFVVCVGAVGPTQAYFH